MKQQLVITHAIRQTEIPALLDSYKHTFCQNVVPTKKKIACSYTFVTT